MKHILALVFLLPFMTFAEAPKDTSVTYIYPKHASFKASVSKLILRIKGKHSLAHSFAENDFDTIGTPMPAFISEEFNVELRKVEGRTVYVIAPKSNANGRTILYMHGGAYVRNIYKQHWGLFAELVRKTNCTVVVPDYPLVPYNTVEDVMPFMEKVYANLLKRSKSDSIIFMGDSAGGGLALAFAQKLKKSGGKQPQQLILFSPWLDVTVSNPEMKKLEGKDPMLDIEGSEMAGKAYAGKLDTKNYLVSPIYGDLTGLAPISLFTGGDEMLVVDARKFKGMMAQKGIPMNYYEYPKMFHVWIVATFLKESRVAVDQVVELVGK